MFSASIRRSYIKFLALVIFAAALYHLVGVFHKVNEAPVARHIVFVFVDLFCVYGLLYRPKYFFYLFLLLTAQQYYTHGGQFISSLALEGEVHWISLAILFLFPLGSWALYLEQESTKRKKPITPKLD